MALRAIEVETHARYEIKDASDVVYTMSRDETGDWVLRDTAGSEVMRSPYRMDIVTKLGAAY